MLGQKTHLTNQQLEVLKRRFSIALFNLKTPINTSYFSMFFHSKHAKKQLEETR